MQLDEKNTKALCKALQALSDEHSLAMDADALKIAVQPFPNDASFYLQTLFPQRTANHTEEMGEAPSGAYPRLLAAYAKASGGAFEPQEIEASSDDSWESLTLTFRHFGKKQRIKVSGIEDSDWFAPDFVKALNRFAKRVALPGRWVDFHNGDDACTSIFVPEAAQSRFKALKKKYSTPSDDEESGWTPVFSSDRPSLCVMFPPALGVLLDKEQLALRKAAWPPIEARLREFVDKSDMKDIARYYMSGAEPKSDCYISDPIPLVFRLWLHPDQSDASWCAITERVLSYQGGGETQLERDRFITTSLEESRGILIRNGSDKGDFLGDACERLTLFLQGRTAPGDRYRHQGQRLYYHLNNFRGIDLVDLSNWLDAATPTLADGNLGYPDEAECWVDYLCSPRFEQRVWELEKYWEKYLEQVAHYPVPAAGHADHARQDYCQRCRDALNTRTLPARLNSLWMKAKGA